MSRRLKGRHQAEQDSGPEGDRGGERQNVPIDLGPADRGQIGRQHGRECVDAPGSDEDPEYAAAHCKQQALGEQLPNHSRTACPEGQSNGDLPPAAGPARKQQVRDVRAGDEEHEADRGQQHQQRRADVADDLLVERDSLRTSRPDWHRDVPAGVDRRAPAQRRARVRDPGRARVARSCAGSTMPARLATRGSAVRGARARHSARSPA